MNIRKVSYSLALVAMFAFAGTAAAQSGTVPRLTMNATAESAMRLEISNGGTATSSGTASDFVVEIGNINALGIGAPATGVTKTVTSGAGAAGYAIYTAPIVLTPVFSGFTTAAIGLSVGGGDNDATAVEGSSAATASVAAARVVVASSLSDVGNTRHVGFKIDKTEANGVREAMLLFTITVGS
jgi:hypothetical protein